MTRNTLTAAERVLDDRIQHIRCKSSIEMAGDGLRKQLRIQTIVIAIVGTIIAIETTAVTILRVCYGV